MKSKPKAPRIAVCTYPGVIEIRGSVRSFALTAGAEVDLDAVVGMHGQGAAAAPVTLAEALGAEYLAFFPAPDARPVAAPNRGHDDQD
jgi:hypothetical protein